MGKKDILAKKYMQNPERFADFFNGYIYNGENRIDWTKLSEIDSAMLADISFSDGKKSRAIQKIRDIIKHAIIMKDDGLYYALLGIENQADIHYAMPVRTMLYDAIAYANQLEQIAKYNRENKLCNSRDFLSGIRKEDKLTPIITVTLYWGTDSWDAPTRLKEMLTESDAAVDKLINDYDINLFSIIDKKSLPEYKTELGELFALLSARNDGKSMRKVVNSNDNYQSISPETAVMMRDFANVKLPRKTKEGGYDMCKAVMEIREEGREEGRILENIIIRKEDGWDDDRILKSIIDKFQLSEKDAKDYMQEAIDIISGKVSAKSYSSSKELFAELD